MRLSAILIAAGLTAFSALPAIGGAKDLALDIKGKRAAIISYLADLPSQRKTLSGTQVNEYEVYIDCTSADRLKEISGRRPAVLGLEMMNAIAYPPYSNYLIDRALTQTQAGGLVTISWHARNPVEVCQRGEYFECSQKAMSAETLRAVLTPGTREYQLWADDVHAMAKTLHALRDKGVVVLFRPYHEMNGGWFWWGKQDAMGELWDALYEELTVKEKLDNLIWVFSIDREAPDAAKYFPKKHKPDIVGTDMYEPDAASWKFPAAKTNLAKLAPNTPFVISETGLAPTQKVLDDLNPSYVLLWGDMLNIGWSKDGNCQFCNKPEAVAAFMKLPRVLSLGELPPAFRAAVSAHVTNPAPLHKPNPICPSKLH
ncbi:mannan endo-1,4-beta-mannosidase [Rhizomicrobium palustre]|uniref:Mannan endo-1,4-beta-mannosidase n=1 Tax=Rhizomicrobium palustre TaxID=189966 RepID=A0A846MVF5_9PROT|nr:glycosyl hydrolase [Rhizomicrobium palustre]NIK87199.1 mannan endo-1,4-beta-mannosidase [Rhizomicrobium palustre]